MSERLMGEAILDGALASINFFNGRLLTAEDLSKEQETRALLDQRLGQAIGSGVVGGLEVSGSNRSITGNPIPLPFITIQPGLALNRLGQALELPSQVRLQLTASGAQITTGADFADCGGISSTSFANSTQGVFVLTIGSASGLEGRAPTSGLGIGGANCAAKYKLQGVRFRVVRLEEFDRYGDPIEQLRNRVAYACFGTEDADLNNSYTDPLEFALSSYGLLDDLRDNPDDELSLGYGLGPHRVSDSALHPCEVPLAILFWTRSGGIQFVDHWAVRRRVTALESSALFRALLGPRRLSEAEAMFYQFEEHLGSLLSSQPQSPPVQITATSHFAFLPPAGILPSSLHHLDFFKGADLQREDLDHTRLRSLLHNSLYLEPFSTGRLPPIQVYQGNRFWLYTTDRLEPIVLPPSPPSPPEPPVTGVVWLVLLYPFQPNLSTAFGKAVHLVVSDPKAKVYGLDGKKTIMAEPKLVGQEQVRVLEKFGYDLEFPQDSKAIWVFEIELAVGPHQVFAEGVRPSKSKTTLSGQNTVQVPDNPILVWPILLSEDKRFDPRLNTDLTRIDNQLRFFR